MIVKVELVQASASVPMVTVESRDGKVRFAVPMTEALRGRMRGQARGYFHAEDDPKTGSFEIGEAAEPEKW